MSKKIIIGQRFVTPGYPKVEYVLSPPDNDQLKEMIEELKNMVEDLDREIDETNKWLENVDSRLLDIERKLDMKNE